MKKILILIAIFCLTAACMAQSNPVTKTSYSLTDGIESDFEITDLTMVAWVQPDEKQYYSNGGVMAVQAVPNYSAPFETLALGGDQWVLAQHPGQGDWKKMSPGTVDFESWDKVVMVIKGNDVKIFYNDELVANYLYKDRSKVYGRGMSLMLGVGQSGIPETFFAGSIEEARLYDRALTEAELKKLTVGKDNNSKPFGWWDFEDPKGRAIDKMGNFPEAEVRDGAFIAGGRLHLDGMNDHMVAKIPYDKVVSPIHYSPRAGMVSDVIPIYANGRWHVFYLKAGVGKVPWEHISSTDLVNWTTHPTALVADGDRVDENGRLNDADAGHMFTGYVIQDHHTGLFHAFYTGHHPDRNPDGNQLTRHAISTDLIHWTKLHDPGIKPDGVIYKEGYLDGASVHWIPEENKYWALFIGREKATDKVVTPRYRSTDLHHWEAMPPLPTSGECQELYEINGTWYMHAAHGNYVIADNPGGPFRKTPIESHIDGPGVYASRSMSDGKRRIWTGWVWGSVRSWKDINDYRDRSWGGTMALPREVYQGRDKRLFTKPAPEVVSVFNKVAFKASKNVTIPKPRAMTSGASANAIASNEDWKAKNSIRKPAKSNLSYDVPEHCLLDIMVDMEKDDIVTIVTRQQEETGEGYYFELRPADMKVLLGSQAYSGRNMEFNRNHDIDTSKPVKIQIFMINSTLECFVNDELALSRRMFDMKGGQIGLQSVKGTAKLKKFEAKIW